RGANVVELDFLGVQRAAGGLNVIFEHLRAAVGAVALAHGARPDAAGHPTDHGVFGVHAVGKEKRQIGREVIDIYAARQIVLDDGKTVGQRKRQLGDGGGSSFGNVVARNGHRVEVAHAIVDEILLDVAHHVQGKLGREDAGVLRLVLLENVG